MHVGSGLLLVAALCSAAAVSAAAAAPSDVLEPETLFTDLPPTPPEPSTEPPEPPEPGCRACRLARCPHTAMECPAGAGLAADPCGCCPGGVCGLAAGERCYNETIMDLDKRTFGVCGDNMDCIARKDLGDTDAPEALCTCRDVGVVCGSDNATYPSSCQMKPARQPSKDEPPVKVWLKHRGPCRAAPWIVTPPTPVAYVAGSPVSLECEVKGYPPPAASWEKINKDGIVTQLPGDDAEVVVMVRGGPEPFMASSFLQIMALREQDVATYICVATNSEGVARTAASITML